MILFIKINKGSLTAEQFKTILLGPSSSCIYAISQKKEIVILKLHFEKAFDKLEHQVILNVMRYKGFPEKWIKWIENILCSGSSSIILNGLPGKSYKCLRGVRQGDPLSPLLFVLAADLLQTIVNRAWLLGVLRHPITFNMPMTPCLSC